MRVILTTILSLFLLSLPSFGLSEERPETIVIPVSSLGEVSEVRKQILQNTLEDELKSHFRLISQERFEEVQEKVFEELDYEECTEDQCIIMIQEMLQVENVFHLQVLGEGDDTQLSLSWRTLDEKRKETDYCEGCKTKKLNESVIDLVGKLVGKSVVEKQVVVEKSKKGILFRRKENGVLKWFKDGNEKTDSRYLGEIINGVPHGQGVQSWYDGENYVGEFKNGEKYGLGTYTFVEGDKYVGDWKDDQEHGIGTYFYSNGSKYIGEHRNGNFEGKGTYTWSDEKIYR